MVRPRVAMPVALAVRAVPHGDQSGLDELPVDRLHLRRRQSERLLLQRGRGPDDRPPSPPPVLRLGEAEQPVDRMHQARRQAEPRRRGLERGQQLSGHRHAIRQAVEALRRAVGLQQAGRQPSKAGGGAGTTSPCASRALSFAIVILPLVGSRRANLSRQRKRQFPLDDEASDG